MSDDKTMLLHDTQSNSDEYVETSCDLCGFDDAEEIYCARKYTGDQPVHVCKNCGLIYVRNRRSAEKIADVWSDEIYTTRSDQQVANSASYSSNIPAVIARLTFIAEVVRSELKVGQKRLCDIGAGEGLFLDLIRQRVSDLTLVGVEPSANNCHIMQDANISFFHGTIERFINERALSEEEKFDVVTIMWTLENCFSARTMLEGANSILRDGGHVVVATGSRIMVPFKKPLDYYLGTNPSDSHAFRFSANTLQRFLTSTGFEVTYRNRFIDNDVLCMIAKKTDHQVMPESPSDSYLEVIDFFERWHKETAKHYS